MKDVYGYVKHREMSRNDYLLSFIIYKGNTEWNDQMAGFDTF